MIKLLLVEDDVQLSYMLQSALEDVVGGYEVIVATNGKEGLEIWKERKPDVIISDIDMPVMNGYQMVEKIREIDKDLPILFASGKTAPKDVTTGYKLGVDNYVKKPFVAEELDAHIRSVLNRKDGGRLKNETNVYKIGSFQFDADHAILTDKSGSSNTLTVREGQVLHLLCKNQNEVVRREAFLSRFWNTEDDFFASRSLDVFITKLRKMLSDDPDVKIKTTKGIGITLITHPNCPDQDCDN